MFDRRKRTAFCSLWVSGVAGFGPRLRASDLVGDWSEPFCTFKTGRSVRVLKSQKRKREGRGSRALGASDAQDLGPDRSPRPSEVGRGATSDLSSSRGRNGVSQTGSNSEGSESREVERIPGRYKLSAVELAEQRRAIRAVAERYRALRIAKEAEARRIFGFCRNAEMINGRTAMFFFATGMLTEYWTGQTMPQQIELLLRILGILN